MELGKSVAWTLFLAVVAVAGGVGHHQQQPASPATPAGAGVQMAAAPAGAGVQMAAPMSSSKVALDTTRSMTIRTVAPVVK